MLRDFWNRLMGREREAAVEHEAERERMSPDERHFEDERVEGHQADAAAQEHLGGFDPERLSEEDEPPA